MRPEGVRSGSFSGSARNSPNNTYSRARGGISSQPFARTYRSPELATLCVNCRWDRHLRASGGPEARSSRLPWMPAFAGMSALREDALLARCKSVSEPVAGSVIEGNCVAARRGGEQPEVNRRRTNLIRRKSVASLLVRGEAWKQPPALRRLTKRLAGSLRG